VSWLFVVFSLGWRTGIYLDASSVGTAGTCCLTPEILKDICFHLPIAEQPRFFGFIFLFTSFLVVCYLMFISMRNPGLQKNSRGGLFVLRCFYRIDLDLPYDGYVKGIFLMNRV